MANQITFWLALNPNDSLFQMVSLTNEGTVVKELTNREL